MAASGDDTVAFVAKSLGQRVRDSVLNNTSRTKVGACALGQCVSKVDVREWWNIEFCSKWAFSPTGKVSDWHFFRDVNKALSTRIYYTKENHQMLSNPTLHATALKDSFECEKISMLI